MKRLVCGMLACGILCSLTGCGEKTLPRPNFPLEQEVVLAAAEQAGLSWNLAEDETQSSGENQILYTFRHPTETFGDTENKLVVAVVNSALDGDRRYLQMSFESVRVPEKPTFSWEDWKQQLMFAALLYGGFPDEDAVYQALSAQETPEEIAEMANRTVQATTFRATDELTALALWEFDDLIANDLRMRRCDYCGRYFIPYSAANCYCDRLVEGSAGKTCKEVGAATKHQEEVNGNAAKTLYRKVNNRTQQAAKRYEPQYPNIRKVNYRNWQYEAKCLLEQVEAGELDYEAFAAAIDKTPKELLGGS